MDGSDVQYQYRCGSDSAGGQTGVFLTIMSRYLSVSGTDHQTITVYRTQSGRCDRHEAAKADVALRLRRHPTPLFVAQGKHGISLIMVNVLNIHERDVQDAPSLCLKICSSLQVQTAIQDVTIKISSVIQQVRKPSHASKNWGMRGDFSGEVNVRWG